MKTPRGAYQIESSARLTWGSSRRSVSCRISDLLFSTVLFKNRKSIRQQVCSKRAISATILLKFAAFEEFMPHRGGDSLAGRRNEDHLTWNKFQCLDRLEACGNFDDSLDVIHGSGL
jgi:hypothetical protein